MSENALDVELEVQHVAVLDDVVLAFLAQLARFTRAGFAVVGDIVLVRDGFGLDEALLEITMDHTGAARCRPAMLERPGARLFRANGEIGL